MNPTLSKTLRLLAHPLTIGAVGLLGLNDFVLKLAWPSIWTGKWSDLAVLFFLPFVLSAGFACAIPARVKPKEWVVLGLSFGIPLLAFTLLKITPETNHWLVSTVQSVTGITIRAVADTTDLLALSSLVAAGWFWRRLSALKINRASLQRGILILPFAVLFTLADAAAPNYGISQLCIHDQAILAKGYFAAFISTDSGLTWSETSLSDLDSCPQSSSDGPINLEDQVRGIRYRVDPGKGIDHSFDGGQSWQADPLPGSMSQAQEIFLRKTRGGNLLIQPGPHDAVIDPATGNLILAMGHEGALVQRPEGPWIWVSIGPFRHAELARSGITGYLNLLSLEIILAAAASLFWFATVTRSSSWAIWRTILLVAGWIWLSLTVLALFPSISTGAYIMIISGGSLLLAVGWAIGLVLLGLLGAGRPTLRIALWTAVFIPLVFFVCLLPYILWSLEIIPSYWIAAGLAVIVIFLTTLLGAKLSNRKTIGKPF